jgi:hypothetical protein
MSDVRADFIKQLYAKCTGCSIGITTLDPKSRTTWFSSEKLDELVEFASKTGSIKDTYIGIFPRRSGLALTTRGDEKDVTYINSVFIDVDVRSDAHTESNLPPTIKDALSVIHEEEKVPSYVFSTGHGLHAYWIFEEPFAIKTDAERARAKAVVSGFVSHMASFFDAHGWKLDNVGDLARMLRFPLSTNFKKGGTVAGSLVESSGALYSFEDFLPYAREQAESQSVRKDVEEAPFGSASRMIEKCAFLKEVAANPDSVSEHKWFMALSNVALASDGNEKCHEISEGYHSYSFDETQKKFENALKSKKPCTCSYIRRNGGCCPSGGCGVKAPVVFSLLTDEERISALMESKAISVREAYDEKNLAMAARLRNSNPGLYQEYRLFLKDNRIGVRDFEKAVKAHSAKARQKTSAVEDFSDSLPICIKGRVFKDLHAPVGYQVTANGVFQQKTDEFGGVTETLVCSEPVIVTRIIGNVDTESMSLELAYTFMNTWKTGTYPRSMLLSKNSILKIADKGFPVSSENSDDMVRYISAFESENRDNLTVGRGVSRAGWVGRSEFYPYIISDRINYEGDDALFIQALCENGDKDKWLDVMGELRKLPFARIQLAAAYASPLVTPLQVRNTILHVWHDSKSGKSACLKAAASIYGNPEKLMFNFNSTLVGFERSAGKSGSLPLFIDELQQLNKSMNVSSLVYLIGNGQGKTRGDKTGGIQQTQTWKLSAITNGEQPMVSDNSMDGVGNRAIQLYARSIDDRRFAQRVHQIVEMNYGFGAKEYLSYVIDHYNDLRGDFEEFREALDEASRKEGFEDSGPHLDGVALFCTADFYSSMAVFNESREEAWHEAVSLGLEALKAINATATGESIELAWRHIEGWIAENRLHFSEKAEPCFGRIEAGKVYIIGSRFKETLESAGFNYTKCIRGFKDKGWIDHEVTKDGSVRCTVQKKIRGINVRAVCARITIATNEDPEEEFL